MKTNSDFNPASPEPGIYAGVPMDVYHSARAVSRSALAILHDEPPGECRRYQQTGIQETPGMALGTAAGMLLCEPERFADRYIIRPAFSGPNAPEEFKGAGAKQRVADWQDRNRDKSWLDQETWDLVHEIERCVRSAPAAKRVLSPEDLAAEVSCVWRDARTGQLCRARPDWWSESAQMTVDLKIAQRGITDRDLQHYVVDRHAELQAAMNLRGFGACGSEVRHHALIFVRTTPTVRCRVVVFSVDDSASPNWLEVGDDLFTALLAEYAVAAESGEWPDYGDRGTTLEVPKFLEFEVGRLAARRDAALAKLEELQQRRAL